MKTENNILIAFILNLSFSIFELIGGIFIGSIAIVSDAFHDFGDAASIAISYFLEKHSKKQADEIYTYGYTRYSAMGGFITTLILILGSILMIYNAIKRIILPIDIDYKAMIVFAIVGVCVNSCAVIFTRHGDSINQKAVNLHMLEDVLGWIVTLIGAILMNFTDLSIIDPIMSIAISIFIFIKAFANLREIKELFLEKVPANINLSQVQAQIKKIKGIIDVHHIHIWRIDSKNIIATMHVVTNIDHQIIKEAIREQLKNYNICHVTIELESSTEDCSQENCNIKDYEHLGNSHHSHSCI